MRWRGPAIVRQGRNLAVALALLGLLHTPLPEADFHNVRHHDAPGEVCEHHDHLLRWHPGAGAASQADVAVLHWHWLWPGDPAESHGDGPALHAHAPGELTGVWPTDTPIVAPGTASRPLDPSQLTFSLPVLFFPSSIALPSGHPPRGSSDGRAPAARGPRLAALLQRWVC